MFTPVSYNNQLTRHSTVPILPSYLWFPKGVDFILSKRFSYMKEHSPTGVKSLRGYLTFNKTRPADCPILHVFTIPDAINVATASSLMQLGSVGSKGVPAFSRFCLNHIIFNLNNSFWLL